MWDVTRAALVFVLRTMSMDSRLPRSEKEMLGEWAVPSRRVGTLSGLDKIWRRIVWDYTIL
jgi:hypothetical protein